MLSSYFIFPEAFFGLVCELSNSWLLSINLLFVESKPLMITFFIDFSFS